MFRYKDGWLFERLEDGTVRIARGKFENNETVIIIDVDSWASIVSSVTKQGENAGTYEAAKFFHNS